MKIKIALLRALFCVLTISGCSYTIHGSFFPVQGPSAGLSTPVVLNVTLRNSKKVSTVSVVLASGESCVGNWSYLTGPAANSEAPGTAAIHLPQPNLDFACDAICGQGYYVAHILGQGFSQGVLTGGQGTVLQMELQGHRGVAVDGKGNIYKMAW